MALTLEEVKNIVLEALNSSKTTYGSNDSVFWKSEEIRDAIFDADYIVASTIAKTTGHPRRYLYLQSTTIATGGSWQNLPESDSAPEGLMISWDAVTTPAQTAPASKIQQWLRNVAAHGGVDVVNGYYDIAGNQIIFSGSSLTYKSYKVSPNATNATNLKTPDIYRSAVAALALSRLLSKEEVFMGAAGFYGSLGRDMVIQIERGKMVIPEFTLYQQNH